MAYMNQARKNTVLNYLKRTLTEQFPKVKIKYSLKVSNHDSLILTIKESNVDLKKDYPFSSYMEHIYDTTFQSSTDQQKEIMHTLWKCLNFGNFSKSDYDSDYFYEGWYTSINLGNDIVPFKHIS